MTDRDPAATEVPARPAGQKPRARSAVGSGISAGPDAATKLSAANTAATNTATTSTSGTLARSRVALWIAFAVVHLWLGYLNLYPAAYGMNDVTYVYRQWAEQAVYGHYWVGIDGTFVYPLLAFAPMLAATFFGFALYGITWLVMVMVLNAVALAAITGWGRRASSLSLGWWWLLFLVLLGPIALSRIDAITIPIGLVAVVLIASRPRVAVLLLTIGAWMKIWPAAIVAAMVVARRDRVKIIEVAVFTTISIVALALAFGSRLNVFSFISEQTGRGLQVEAPITTPWMWQAFAGVPGASVYYDTDILTYQVTGAGATTAAALMTPLLVLVVALICGLALLALRRGTNAATLLPLLALALVVALIAFNKVGSPQFMSWLAVPIVLGLATRAAGRGFSFGIPAAIALTLALLTQLIYPYLYNDLIMLNPAMLLILTLRNVLTFVLLGWAISRLVVVALPTRGRGMSHRPAPAARTTTATSTTTTAATSATSTTAPATTTTASPATPTPAPSSAISPATGEANTSSSSSE
ncbi:MAG: hypothetical protein JWQ43_3003 [Glaciihabitans sp.]|nr:hypothetical protein [Glaciihabitans sp.]